MRWFSFIEYFIQFVVLRHGDELFINKINKKSRLEWMLWLRLLDGRSSILL